MSRKGRKGFASIEGCVNTFIHGLEDYIKKRKERLITVANNNSGNMRIIEKQQKLENINGKKNNCMDTSSDTLVTLNTR